jgi:pyridinium-3,5-bisthiocarboxylic acid mononucleotide nickel chelatase
MEGVCIAPRMLSAVRGSWGQKRRAEMKIAYFDCFSGISGDMVLGALIDLGLPLDVLLAEFRKLAVSGYSIRAERERRGSIAGTRVRIDLEDQPARSYRDIRRLIEDSALDGPVKAGSLAVFEKLAHAEAKVHQTAPEDVHFHEVGALDSILDIVGTAIGLHHLGVDRVCASRIPLGGGFVETHHGLLPIPAPATVLLLEGAPVYDNGVQRELVTPTGAAILAALAESFGPVPDMVLRSTGYGVGTHPSADPPNLLRVLYGDSSAALLKRRLLIIETSIDDMNPELYNYVMERLFDLGVLDVNLVPVQMKKNRPAVILRVLLEPAFQSAVTELIFKETTSLGVRVQEVERVELPREIGEVVTQYGACRVKWVSTPWGERRATPEYEDCRRIALEHGVPIRKVYEEALAAAGRQQ